MIRAWSSTYARRFKASKIVKPRVSFHASSEPLLLLLLPSEAETMQLDRFASTPAMCLSTNRLGELV